MSSFIKMFEVIIQLCLSPGLSISLLLLTISLVSLGLYNEKSFFGAFCAEIQTQFHVSVQTLRSDNPKEYLSELFQSFMLQHEIFY